MRARLVPTGILITVNLCFGQAGRKASKRHDLGKIEAGANQPLLGLRRSAQLAKDRTKSCVVEDTMSGSVDKKLASLGISLPTPATPIANYVPFVRSGNMLVVSGQLCFGADGNLVARGQLGGEVSMDDGQKAARACAVNLLAQLKAALGDLDKVTRVIRLGGFINSTPGFTDGPKVMNGASDLMVEVFGEKGRHARSTVGVAALPANAAVEVEGQFEVS